MDIKKVLGATVGAGALIGGGLALAKKFLYKDEADEEILEEVEEVEQSEVKGE